LSDSQPFAIGRVTASYIFVYQKPTFNSERLENRGRDELIALLEEIQSPAAPNLNPLWYRIDSGYIHSAYIQRINHQPDNPTISYIPPAGMLGVITVPYTRVFYQTYAGMKPLYRLYYDSIHWITAFIKSPDGSDWYELTDHKIDARYCVPAAHIRPLDPSEYSPIARDVPMMDKRITVSIEKQTLKAYEGEKCVLDTIISSGVPTKNPVEGDIPTDTPQGFYRISQKMPSRHMGEGHLTDQVTAYELPGVPWMMAFHKTGASLHGSYWHNNFGHKMSHGCINMRNAEALWLFRWTDPVFDPSNWYVNGLGTLVQVL
jgi:hypothetical protein